MGSVHLTSPCERKQEEEVSEQHVYNSTYRFHVWSGFSALLSFHEETCFDLLDEHRKIKCPDINIQFYKLVNVVPNWLNWFTIQLY